MAAILPRPQCVNISLPFVPEDPAATEPSLVQIMVWWETCNKQLLNSLTPERCESNSRSIIFHLIKKMSTLGTRCQIALRMIPQDFTNHKSTLGSSKGLVLLGNKPLPEPMLIKIHVAIWSHWDTICVKPRFTQFTDAQYIIYQTSQTSVCISCYKTLCWYQWPDFVIMPEFPVNINLLCYQYIISVHSKFLRINSTNEKSLMWRHLYCWMVKSMLVNKDLPTCHLIGWQHSCQPIGSHVRKSLFTNMEFNIDFTE